MILRSYFLLLILLDCLSFAAFHKSRINEHEISHYKADRTIQLLRHGITSSLIQNGVYNSLQSLRHRIARSLSRDTSYVRNRNSISEIYDSRLGIKSQNPQKRGSLHHDVRGFEKTLRHRLKRHQRHRITQSFHHKVTESQRNRSNSLQRFKSKESTRDRNTKSLRHRISESHSNNSQRLDSKRTKRRGITQPHRNTVTESQNERVTKSQIQWMYRSVHFDGRRQVEEEPPGKEDLLEVAPGQELSEQQKAALAKKFSTSKYDIDVVLDKQGKPATNEQGNYVTITVPRSEISNLVSPETNNPVTISMQPITGVEYYDEGETPPPRTSSVTKAKTTTRYKHTTTTQKLRRPTPRRPSLDHQCDYIAKYCHRSMVTSRICARTLHYRYFTFPNYCAMHYANCNENVTIFQHVHMGSCFTPHLMPLQSVYNQPENPNEDAWLDEDYFIVEEWDD